MRDDFIPSLVVKYKNAKGEVPGGALESLGETQSWCLQAGIAYWLLACVLSPLQTLLFLSGGEHWEVTQKKIWKRKWIGLSPITVSASTWGTRRVNPKGYLKKGVGIVVTKKSSAVNAIRIYDHPRAFFQFTTAFALWLTWGWETSHFTLHWW